MARRLALRAEPLASLSDEDLRLAAGGAGGEMTGHIRCVLSVDPPCVTNFCTIVCVDTGAS